MAEASLPSPVNTKINSFDINSIKLRGKSNKRQLTNLSPVRRSRRITSTVLQLNKQKNLEEQVNSSVEDGLIIQSFNGKGRSIVATKCFERGDYVVEYCGELLNKDQAKIRENQYSLDLNIGCYMYYFKFQDRQYCIDSTAETDYLGRLINHSKNGNLVTNIVTIGTLPRLVFFAKKHISIGEELSFDYGDRSKESIKQHPWLAS